MKTSKTISMQKVAIYTRVSTQMQADRASLPVQRDELINYAKYALNIAGYEIFEDAGYSAKNTYRRPSYQQMMSRTRSGEFSHILVWKIDRISRNLLDFAEMYKEVKSLGVVFVSKNEQFDTSTAIGEAMLKIILIFAELERKMTSERVSSVMLSRANKGIWNGGKVPLGYSYDATKKEFSILDGEAAIVKRLFCMYADGTSLLGIAKALNSENVKPRSKNSWNPTTIRNILRNPFYLGIYRWNYRSEDHKGTVTIKDEKEWTVIPNHHAQLIDEDIFTKCGDRLAKNNRSSVSTKTYQRKHINIFAGMLNCWYCGEQMVSGISRQLASGIKPSNYTCRSKRRSYECPNKYITDVKLGNFIFNLIANIVKLQSSIGKSTSLETFKKKLIRGDVFSNVKDISDAGLQEFYKLLIAKKHEEYIPNIFINTNPSIDNEREFLLSEKRKQERALIRLKNLYLYSDTQMPNKDFITEQQSILDAIKQCDDRLKELNLAQPTTLSDESFISKASQFIIANELSAKRSIDYRFFIQSIDKKIARDFVASVVQNFCIKDGQIMSILFKNNIELHFAYDN